MVEEKKKEIKRRSQDEGNRVHACRRIIRGKKRVGD